MMDHTDPDDIQITQRLLVIGGPRLISREQMAMDFARHLAEEPGISPQERDAAFTAFCERIHLGLPEGPRH